jgi:hypothetical protein
MPLLTFTVTCQPPTYSKLIALRPVQMLCSTNELSRASHCDQAFFETTFRGLKVNEIISCQDLVVQIRSVFVFVTWNGLVQFTVLRSRGGFQIS